jgi:hypothetical protein
MAGGNLGMLYFGAGALAAIETAGCDYDSMGGVSAGAEGIRRFELHLSTSHLSRAQTHRRRLHLRWSLTFRRCVQTLSS